MAGDLVRTLDQGFQQVLSVNHEEMFLPTEGLLARHLPVHVPANTVYNGRSVWLLPDQNMLVDTRGTGSECESRHAAVPARNLNGFHGMKSHYPGQHLKVATLLFAREEVVFIEGGMLAHCRSISPSLRVGRDKISEKYPVLGGKDATELVNKIAQMGDTSALANQLGVLPAPITQDPVFPLRPVGGVRRPHRPGRPKLLPLFLRSEWQI